MATLSPASAKARAMARPMPRVPPVTRTERLKGPPSLVDLRRCLCVDVSVSTQRHRRGVEVVQDVTARAVPYPRKLSVRGRRGGIGHPQGRVPLPVDFLQKPANRVEL